MRRNPEGLDRHNENKKTPLDVAFDYLNPQGQEVIVDLINRGASEASFSVTLCKKIQKRIDLSPAFFQALDLLQKRNAKIKWVITREELFPLAENCGKQTPTLVKLPNEEYRLLTKDMTKQIKDPGHQVKEGRRKVVRVGNNSHIAYIKFFPELVGIEEIIGDLTRNVIGFGAPYGELFRFPDGSPAWVSQEIPGDTLKWVLENEPNRLSKLDPVSTFNFILMAMLVNPEDGKPDNYIVEPLPDNPNLYRLSCPDNEHGFVPAFVRSKPKLGGVFGDPTVQVKTILYCLDHMHQPIPDETRELFLRKNPYEIMRTWLDRAIKRAKQYETLYKASEMFDFLKKNTFIGIPFQKGMIYRLYSKWERLQEGLKSDTGLTPWDLLNKLEPRLARRYRDVASGNKPLWERFKKVDGPFYHRSGKTLTASGNILTSQNIPLKEEVLDSIRKGNALGASQAKEELNTITQQFENKKNVFQEMKTSFQREDYLKNLKERSNKTLSSIEKREILNQIIPHAHEFRTFFLQNFDVLDDTYLIQHFLLKQLVELNLKGCVNVTHNIIKKLGNEEMPGLERLTLSNLPKLQWVADYSIIGYSTLIFPQLSHLVLNDCAALEAIDIQAPKLRRMWVDRDNKLKFFRVKANDLQSLSCEKSSLTDGMLCDILLERPKLTLHADNNPNIIYQRFLNGVLVYKPNQDSDEGMVRLPIRNLANPLKGTFDLSECGDIGKYISISTGYREAENPENKDKIEMWLAPRFLVEAKLDGSARHLKEIFGDWVEGNAMGIFWTRGSWEYMEWYDYLVTKDLNEISASNFYDLWLKAKNTIGKNGQPTPHRKALTGKPRVFINPNPRDIEKKVYI